MLLQGVPHGLRIGYDGETGYLLHANNGAIIAKTDLDGKIIWRTNQVRHSLFQRASFPNPLPFADG